MAKMKIKASIKNYETNDTKINLWLNKIKLIKIITKL